MISLNVNGKAVQADVDGDTPLLWVLRDHLDMTGTKFGCGMALCGAITLKDGIVEQSNFHDYPVLRMNQMPRVEVHIVPSQEKPTGVGEPGTPVIAPALANAILAMQGKPVRSLPLSTQGVAFA